MFLKARLALTRYSIMNIVMALAYVVVTTLDLGFQPRQGHEKGVG
jgi:hypothetical protein